LHTAARHAANIARPSDKVIDWDLRADLQRKASGKSTNGRLEFAQLLKATVVVTKFDQLVRSSRDLHNIIHELEGSFMSSKASPVAS
jgi:DNA invertase Pin-like site-specific DNA recombinase